MKSVLQRRLRHVSTSLAALLALASAARPAHADRVQLLVQAPYDFETGSWDLNLLDERLAHRVFDQELSIPYDEIEQQVLELLGNELYTRQGTVECSFVIDEGCPDVDWSVSFDRELSFLQRGQPVLTPFGSATDNGVRVSLDGRPSCCARLGGSGRVRGRAPGGADRAARLGGSEAASNRSRRTCWCLERSCPRSS